MGLNQQRHHQRNQQGFVLVLVLVMLAVLTLIGVSSMTSSSMELKAVGNAKQHSIAFNVVQSVIEYAVSSDPAVVAALDFQTNDVNDTSTVTASVNKGTSLSATVQFSGCGVAPGSSLQPDKGFSYNFFNITASGANASGKASSTQVQGVRFPAASC
jgi:Tfp pilus assembly protein PilX